jgi:hypothetical protein
MENPNNLIYLKIAKIVINNRSGLLFQHLPQAHIKFALNYANKLYFGKEG